jgi:LacI family transcriptional regulator
MARFAYTAGCPAPNIARLKPPKKVSVHDVAREAGVSIGSVSRVLNGGRYTSADLVARVNAAVRKLGWQPDAKAQSLRSGASRTIGCLVTDITNPLYAACVAAIETRLAADGYMMLLACSRYDAEREAELLQLFQARGMDGLIVATLGEEEGATQEALRSSRVPVVLLDRELRVERDVVLIDHRSGVASAVQYLAAMGHKRIALFTPGMAMRPGRERMAGYTEAHQALGLPLDRALVRGISNQIHTSYDEMAQMLRGPKAPTAVIALGNQILSGVLRAIHEANQAIPGDISVISIGSSTSDFNYPPLTQVRFDVEANGRVAAEVLLERLRHPEAAPRTVTLATQLVVGSSCAAPRKK